MGKGLGTQVRRQVTGYFSRLQTHRAEEGLRQDIKRLGGTPGTVETLPRERHLRGDDDLSAFTRVAYARAQWDMPLLLEEELALLLIQAQHRTAREIAERRQPSVDESLLAWIDARLRRRIQQLADRDILPEPPPIQKNPRRGIAAESANAVPSWELRASSDPSDEPTVIDTDGTLRPRDSEADLLWGLTSELDRLGAPPVEVNRATLLPGAVFDGDPALAALLTRARTKFLAGEPLTEDEAAAVRYGRRLEDNVRAGLLNKPLRWDPTELRQQTATLQDRLTDRN